MAARRPRPNLSETENQLFSELLAVRKFGLFDRQDRVHRLGRLVDIARGLPGSSDRARVEQLLRDEIRAMGAVFGPALLMLLGIASVTHGTKASARDKLAYETFCAAEEALCASPDEASPPVFATFRTHTKDEMLEVLSRRLERRVQAERERQRAELERRLGNSNLADGGPLAHTEKSKGAFRHGGRE
jgi:hypothetical protein